ncbi:KRAB-A domain-containing protein 2-like [Oratosquilla oratoria]|uniref:KRAB-A domain-containing protein 2-like n=1 Tax=Oratosquilla oratoria TaxID=337810 RepID=UPI003F76C52A
MRTGITRHVEHCTTYSKLSGTDPRPLNIGEVPIPSEPWDTMGIGLLKLPPTHQGSYYVLAAIDYFFKYTILVPLPDKSGETVAQTLVDHIFCKHNIPRQILSDNGIELRNNVLQKIAKLHHINRIYSTRYHP